MSTSDEITQEGEITQEKAEEIETAVADQEASPIEATSAPAVKRRIGWTRVLAFGVLPVVALLLGAAAGFLRYEDSSRRDADRARAESVTAARDSAVAMLTYQSDTVEKDLGAARDRLTGKFLEAYTELTTEVVIPGAKEKSISAKAEVPAAASVSVSAKADHAVVLLFVDQMVSVGRDAPTNTASSVRVTLEKVHDRWLITGFEPV